MQNTPTLSCGFAFTTDFEAICTPLSIAIPNNVTSTIFNKALSTDPINTHFIPFSFISAKHPLLLNEEYVPPFPSDANFTNLFFPISNFPSKLTSGNSPCTNNVT